MTTGIRIVKINQKMDEEFANSVCEDFLRLDPQDRRQYVEDLIKRISVNASQQQVIGSNQNVIGAYQVIISTEGFETITNAIAKLILTLKDNFDDDFVLDLTKSIVMGFADGLGKKNK
jgi:hypothetical protein